MKPEPKRSAERPPRNGTLAAEAASPKQSKSSSRRDAILRHATELFDQRGYSNTSLDDIAQAVGVTREALYYYYRNRSEILLAIIRPQSMSLIDGLDRIMTIDVSSHERLHLAIENHLRSFDRYCLEMTIGLRDGLMDVSDPVRKTMGRIWKRYEGLWIRLVADGQRNGEFDQIGDAKMIAFGILGMCNWLARWYNPRKQVSIDEIIATYTNLIGSGLLAQRPEQK